MSSKFNSIIKHAFKLTVTVGVIYWIIHNYGWNNIKHSVLDADIKFLLLGFFMFIVSIFFGAVQWHIILKNRGIEIPFSKALKIYFTGIFFNNFILGMIAGDGYKVAALHINHDKGKGGFAATFIERLAGLVVLSLFAIIGGAIIFATNIQQNKDMIPVLGVLSIFIAIFFGFFLILLSKTLQNFVKLIFSKLPNFPKKELLENLMDVTFLNRENRDDILMIMKVGVISTVIQSLRIGVNISAAAAIGIFSFSLLHYFFVIIPVIALMMIIPMPFGVRETAGGILFGMAGFSKADSVVMLFLATIVSVAASLAGGIFFLLDKKKN